MKSSELKFGFLADADAQITRLRQERDEARVTARLLAHAHEQDAVPGLVFRQALARALAYPVVPEE